MNQRDLEVCVVGVVEADTQFDGAHLARVGHLEPDVEGLVVEDRKGIVAGELAHDLRPTLDRDVDTADRTFAGPPDLHGIAGQERLPAVRRHDGEAPLHLLDVDENGVEAGQAGVCDLGPKALHARHLRGPVEGASRGHHDA